MADPRIDALAAVFLTLMPDRDRDYARYYARDYAYARARYYADAYAYARARDYARAPFTDEQKAQIDAAYTLLFK